jgi:hypothetical protein
VRETEAGRRVKTTNLASALATHQDQRSKIGLDPRLGTELGRLALHDELTSAQVSAGFRIAEIYHAFEFFHDRTRSAAGSSFFRQFVADLEKPIEVSRRRTDDYIDIDRRSGSARRVKISTCFSFTCRCRTRPYRTGLCRKPADQPGIDPDLEDGPAIFLRDLPR